MSAAGSLQQKLPVNLMDIGLYTVNHKKGGSTYVIITLENLDGF